MLPDKSIPLKPTVAKKWLRCRATQSRRVDFDPTHPGVDPKSAIPAGLVTDRIKAPNDSNALCQKIIANLEGAKTWRYILAVLHKDSKGRLSARNSVDPVATEFSMQEFL
jgi:hypothetical protein